MTGTLKFPFLRAAWVNKLDTNVALRDERGSSGLARASKAPVDTFKGTLRVPGRSNVEFWRWPNKPSMRTLGDVQGSLSLDAACRLGSHDLSLWLRKWPGIQ